MSPGARRPGFKIQLQTYQLGSLVSRPQSPSWGGGWWGIIISQLVRVVREIRQEKACECVLLVERIQPALMKEVKTLQIQDQTELSAFA